MRGHGGHDEQSGHRNEGREMVAPRTQSHGKGARERSSEQGAAPTGWREIAENKWDAKGCHGYAVLFGRHIISTQGATPRICRKKKRPNEGAATKNGRASPTELPSAKEKAQGQGLCSKPLRYTRDGQESQPPTANPRRSKSDGAPLMKEEIKKEAERKGSSSPFYPP